MRSSHLGPETSARAQGCSGAQEGAAPTMQPEGHLLSTPQLLQVLLGPEHLAAEPMWTEVIHCSAGSRGREERTGAGTMRQQERH